MTHTKLYSGAMIGFISGLALVTAGFCVEPAPDGSIVVTDVVVEFERLIDVPARSSGVIQKINICKNQECSAGELLAHLDDSQLSIRRRSALLHLERSRQVLRDDIEARYAQAALEEAEAELEDSRLAHETVRGAIAKNQLRRLQLAVERGHLEVARVEKQRREAEIDEQLCAADLAVIEEELSRLKCPCPIDGVVLNLHRQEGEWVQAGESVATIASVGVLRLQALIGDDVIDGAFAKGMPVEVRWEAPSGNGTLPGKILSIDPTRLPGHQVRLHAAVVNRRRASSWQLVPGMEVTLHIPADAIRSSAKEPEAGPERLR